MSERSVERRSAEHLSQAGNQSVRTGRHRICNGGRRDEREESDWRHKPAEATEGLYGDRAGERLEQRIKFQESHGLVKVRPSRACGYRSDPRITRL